MNYKYFGNTSPQPPQKIFFVTQLPSATLSSTFLSSCGWSGSVFRSIRDNRGCSSPCGHICSWGLRGTQAGVKERPGWRKHSQLQLLTLSPQLTPRTPPPPTLPTLPHPPAWLHYSNPWRSRLSHTGSVCRHIKCLQNLDESLCWKEAPQVWIHGDILNRRHLSLDYGSVTDCVLQHRATFLLPRGRKTQAVTKSLRGIFWKVLVVCL